MVLPTDTTGAKILIVDDQASNVRLLEHTLRRGGFNDVMSTTMPRQVLELHTEHHYDLILLDLQMPEMNGFEVMKQLHSIEDAPPVAILVLSADATQTAAVAKEGASFLAKPFKLPDVVARVQRILEAQDAPGPPR